MILVSADSTQKALSNELQFASSNFLPQKTAWFTLLFFDFREPISLRVFVSREQLFQQREKLLIEQGKLFLFKKNHFIIKKLIKKSNTNALNHKLLCNCPLCRCPMCNCLTVQMDHCARVGAPYFRDLALYSQFLFQMV